jgi:hypothetical protein
VVGIGLDGRVFGGGGEGGKDEFLILCLLIACSPNTRPKSLVKLNRLGL